MISYTTFDDIIQHGLDYLGSNISDQAKRDCVRAALEAYRDLVNAFNWSYYYKQGRLITNSAYDSTVAGATVGFLQSSGAYPRQCTITGDTWPLWAGDATIRIGGTDGSADESGDVYVSVGIEPISASVVGYNVDQRKSATILTLDEVVSPNFDIPSGTDFLLYQDTYLLPDDFVSQDQALYELNWGGMQYTHPREWLFENRFVFASGVPQFFTITGDRKYPGRLVMRMFPWPYESKTVDFIYKRRPSPLLLQSYKVGTVSVSANNNTLTGVGTAFTPAMVGSTIRISSNTSAPSSLIMGTNVAAFETVIQGWVSPTALVLQDDLTASYSGVGYVISDTVDIEPGSMLNAYLRCVEKHIGMSRTLKDKPSAAKQYETALAEAKCADSRSFAGRSPGSSSRQRPRLRDMPMGPDQP